MVVPKEIFVIHPSVFHDAFRTDYDTPFRQTSKDFFDLLLKHYREKNCKIAYVSWEVFNKLFNSELGKSRGFRILVNSLLTIDISTPTANGVSLEKSTIRLASKKSAKYSPFIVATKKKENIETEGTNFQIYTPKEAIAFYPTGRF